MQANYVQRLRITFGKTGPTRYIGHLDLARTLERALVRAQIPIAYSQGFNRRPRMALATALPLGFTSDGELVDIWLQEALPPQEVRERMIAKMAPGIIVHQVEEVPVRGPSLESLTRSATYTAALLDDWPLADLRSRVAQVLAADALPCERRRGKNKVKRYDLRPLIYDLSATGSDAEPLLHMHLALEPGKHGRPDDVLTALGLDPLAARIHRTAIQLAAAPPS